MSLITELVSLVKQLDESIKPVFAERNEFPSVQ